jgi:hypothetical protein
MLKLIIIFLVCLLIVKPLIIILWSMAGTKLIMFAMSKRGVEDSKIREQLQNMLKKPFEILTGPGNHIVNSFKSLHYLKPIIF